MRLTGVSGLRAATTGMFKMDHSTSGYPASRFDSGSAYTHSNSQSRLDRGLSFSNMPVNGYPVNSRISTDCGRGVMKVEIHMATGINGGYFFGLRNCSAYVVMKYGHDKKKLQSHIHRGSGAEPRWNETFSYNIMNPSAPENTPLLHFEIWNHHYFTRKHNVLGRVSINNILQYVASKPLQRTQHMWLPIFHVSSKRHTLEQQGKLLVRFHFESKDETYFGDGLYRDDHTYRHGEKSFDDMTATCIEPSYAVLNEIPVDHVAGTVIQLAIT
ncbi:hypothetical protein R1flu_000663 [Riccia fluitans]|uniref:C2 domain-containing protein n=1 Tax=Riccia fluitans TaxID=41844 RepID=A0ABD1Y123_9MARC